MEKRHNVGMRMSGSTINRLDKAVIRLGRSRVSVVEILINLHADTLSGETLIPASAIPATSRAKRKDFTVKKR